MALKLLSQHCAQLQTPYLCCRCTVFHFAGHGYTDRDDSSRSYLTLGENDQKDPLTVAELLDKNLRRSAPFLAYLSACSTGRVIDKRFHDESMHLVSAFQLAGFRHVIGTLWGVRDHICAKMAELVSSGISQAGPLEDEIVCKALHRTTVQLHKQ
jgi:CHAT domain-containing protein